MEFVTGGVAKSRITPSLEKDLKIPVTLEES